MMNTLTTKIQYKAFEPGEFVQEKQRSYEETVVLIEQFPWEKERENIHIGLTNPSVTIQNENNEFLKLALSYNGKFVLHYLDPRQQLFTKTFFKSQDAYPYIESFFEKSYFDLTSFKKETTWMQKNLIHFLSQDFNYVVNKSVIESYLLKTSGLNFIMPFFCIGLIFFHRNNNIYPMNIIGDTLLFIICFFLGGGLNLILFFNYYSFVKNKLLIMTRGNDVFFFGDKNNLIQFNKSNIQLVERHKPYYKSPVASFCFFVITFKDGSKIRIPNLLVATSALEDKLYKFTPIDRQGFPYLSNKT